MIISSKMRLVGMRSAYIVSEAKDMVTRDPLSVWFDAAALRLLERAYANKGQWTGVYLAPPSVPQRARAAMLGFPDLTSGRDRWGEVRWVRAFKRSVYWNHKKFGYSDGLHPGNYRNSPYAATALTWETGQRLIKRGWPSRRWAIRVAVHQSASVAKVPESKRWVINNEPTDLQSTVADRDW
jgi:hypothetical protein